MSLTAVHSVLRRGPARGGVPRVRAAARGAGPHAAARALLALAPRVPPVRRAAQRAQPAHGAAQRPGVRGEGPQPTLYHIYAIVCHRASKKTNFHSLKLCLITVYF